MIYSDPLLCLFRSPNHDNYEGVLISHKEGAWCHGWICGCCLGRCCAGLTALSKQLPTKKVELRINLGAANLAQKAKPLLVEHVRMVKCKV